MHWELNKKNAINRVEMIFCDGKTENEIILHLQSLWLKQMYAISSFITQH